MAYLI